MQVMRDLQARQVRALQGDGFRCVGVDSPCRDWPRRDMTPEFRLIPLISQDASLRWDTAGLRELSGIF